ncbi:hypothetical protein Bca4012_062629 [Brassica carinata]
MDEKIVEQFKKMKENKNKKWFCRSQNRRRPLFQPHQKTLSLCTMVRLENWITLNPTNMGMELWTSVFLLNDKLLWLHMVLVECCKIRGPRSLAAFSLMFSILEASLKLALSILL